MVGAYMSRLFCCLKNGVSIVIVMFSQVSTWLSKHNVRFSNEYKDMIKLQSERDKQKYELFL